MKIDNVSFADGFVEGFATEKDFLKEMSTDGYKHIYDNDKDKLKKAYALHHFPDKKYTQQAEGSTESQ